MDPVEISAGTLHLRPWAPYDEPSLLALFRDPEVVRWTPAPVPFTVEEARTRLTETWPALWAEETGGCWAVLDSTTAEVLGWVGVFGLKDGVAEIGWAALPAARGRGATSDAVAAVCRWAQAVLGVQRLEAVIAVGNWASRAVAEKCGFTVEGVRRRGMQQRGARLDCWVASLLAGDEVADRRPLPALPDLTDGVVRLRRWTGADADVVQRACDDPLTARWLPVPSPYTREAALGWLEGMVVPEWAEGRVASVAVVDAVSGEVLGDVGLTLADRPPGVGEVGYWTAPWARGRGVAARGAALLAGWGLEALGLRRVEVLVDVDNAPSQRAAERAGFVREGVARSGRTSPRTGEPRDMVLFSRVAADAPPAATPEG